MLFIFRKLRKSFFLPGKARTYLAYALGEIVLIVLGIMIALQISEWNQSQIDRSSERFYLNQMLSELASDRPVLQTDLDSFNEKRTISKKLLRELNQENNPEAFKQALQDYIDKAISVPFFQPKTSTFDELKSSGKLAIIYDSELRNQIVSFYNSYEDLSYNIELNTKFVTGMDIELAYDRGFAKYMEFQRPLFEQYISADDLYQFKGLKEILENHAASHHWSFAELAPAFESQISALDELSSLIQAALEAH